MKMINKALFGSLVAIVPVVFLVPGHAQSQTIRAPFDAVVCLNKSLVNCADEVDQFSKSRLRNLDTGGQVISAVNPNDVEKLATAPIQQYIGAGGQTTNYTCSYNPISFSSRLKSAAYPVLFYSPELINEINQAIYKLQKAEYECADLIDAFNFDVKEGPDRDMLAKSTDGVASVSAMIATELSGHEGVGVGADPVSSPLITASVAAEWDVQIPHPGVDDKRYNVLDTAHQHAVAAGKSIRQATLDHVMSDLYGQKFRDAQLEISSRSDDLSRLLFLLDLCGQSPKGGVVPAAGIATGTWVARGAIVGASK